MDTKHNLMNEKNASKKYRIKLNKSQGVIKVRNYFLDLIDRRDFKEKVQELRIKHKIPVGGFSKRERHITPDDGPKYPKRWAAQQKKPFDSVFWLYFFADEKILGEKFQIPPNSLNIIDEYVLYSEITLTASDTPALCMVQDYSTIGKYKEIDRANNTGLPILIRISPYAGERDILDFVKTVFTHEIAPLQEKYADKTTRLSKIRTRKQRERNKIAYETKGLSTKELAIFLSSKGYSVDEGSVGKLKSLEKIRRKEV